jgi:hypothetical protein
VASTRIATAESAPATIEVSLSSSLRTSRRPLQIFAAIFVVAGIIHSFHLGTDALGASEAYSAWAAAKPVGAIVRTPVLHDPGKQVFYYLVLHFYTRIFGLSEISLRSLSVIFSLATLLLVFALGCEMFDDHTALAASAIWAFNPLAVAFAHTARMYPMLIAVALAHLLTLWRVRERPSMPRAVVCGVVGTALLYTHLGGVLFIGAGVAMLARDEFRRQRKRNAMAWLAITITLALFAPYAPIARAQSQTLIAGHWLDWIGKGHEYSLAVKVAFSMLAAAVALWLVVGTRGSDRNDRFVWLAAWTILPGLALAAGAIAIRPMFNLRYVAPSTVTLTLLFAAAFAQANVKWRNLLAAGIPLACLILLPFDSTPAQPWRELAAQVKAGGASVPVFFESGFVSTEGGPNVANDGFPFGYYLIPFNYYLSGDNPRLAIPGYDPASARMMIESRVSSAGGGWLVSWKDRDAVTSELPDRQRFSVVEKLHGDHLLFYRIAPIGR